MKELSRIIVRSIRVLVSCLAVLVCLWIVARAFLFFLPQIGDEFPYFYYPSRPAQSTSNLEDSYNDHERITEVLYSCIGIKDSEYLSRELQAVFNRLSRLSDEEQTRARYTGQVPHIYIRIARLSRSIAERRQDAEFKFEVATKDARAGAFTSIVIGLLTTILVGLSSTEFGKDDTTRGRLIRIGALVLPAIGTAAAAVLAYFNFSGIVAQQNLIATGFGQLHTQIQLEVFKLDCPASNINKSLSDLTAKYEPWSQRYMELVTAASDSRSQKSADKEKKD